MSQSVQNLACHDVTPRTVAQGQESRERQSYQCLCDHEDDDVWRKDLHGDDGDEGSKGNELCGPLTEFVDGPANEGEPDELADLGRLSQERLRTGTDVSEHRLSRVPDSIEHAVRRLSGEYRE